MACTEKCCRNASFETYDAVWSFNGFDYTPTYRASRCDECKGLTTGSTKRLSVSPGDKAIFVCNACYREAEGRGRTVFLTATKPEKKRHWWNG